MLSYLKCNSGWPQRTITQPLCVSLPNLANLSPSSFVLLLVINCRVILWSFHFQAYQLAGFEAGPPVSVINCLLSLLGSWLLKACMFPGLSPTCSLQSGQDYKFMKSCSLKASFHWLSHIQFSWDCFSVLLCCYTKLSTDQNYTANSLLWAKK